MDTTPKPTPTPRSWKTEVLVQGTWGTNSLRFATKDEAERAGVELLDRWYVPTDSRAAESDDEINAEFPVGTSRPNLIEKAAV